MEPVDSFRWKQKIVPLPKEKVKLASSQLTKKREHSIAHFFVPLKIVCSENLPYQGFKR